MKIFSFLIGIFVFASGSANASDGSAWICTSQQPNTKIVAMKYSISGTQFKAHSQDNAQNAFLDAYPWQILQNSAQGLVAIASGINTPNVKEDGHIWSNLILLDKKSGDMLEILASPEETFQTIGRWQCLAD